MDGDRQEEDEEDNPHGEPPKSERQVDSAYSPAGDQRKAARNCSCHHFLLLIQWLGCADWKTGEGESTDGDLAVH